MADRLKHEIRKGRPKGYGFRTRAEGQRLRCIKGARHAHEVIRASGRVLGEEARLALARKRRSPKCNPEFHNVRWIVDSARPEI